MIYLTSNQLNPSARRASSWSGSIGSDVKKLTQKEGNYRKMERMSTKQLVLRRGQINQCTRLDTQSRVGSWAWDKRACFLGSVSRELGPQRTSRKSARGGFSEQWSARSRRVSYWFPFPSGPVMYGNGKSAYLILTWLFKVLSWIKRKKKETACLVSSIFLALFFIMFIFLFLLLCNETHFLLFIFSWRLLK
jgi:hypothetical protein